MTKFLGLILFVLFALAGCQKDVQPLTDMPPLPKGLADCQFYHITRGMSSQDLYVIRCPNSDTSVTFSQRSGKSSHTTSTATVNF